MEERGVPNYELHHVSFSTVPGPPPPPSQGINDELGFVQFEENQVLSFLAPSSSSSTTTSHHPHHHSSSQHISHPPSAAAAGTSTNVAAAVGFCHDGDHINTRPSWNNEQVLVRNSAPLVFENSFFRDYVCSRLLL